MNYNLITILGPTATGKTLLAAHLAKQINGEIISGDSRQIYRGMDIGTGKDLEDYAVDNTPIPYHLIDIADAGEKYNVYRFQQDFVNAFNNINSRNKMPILCGGTGLYIEAILGGYRMLSVPPNQRLREELKGKTLETLKAILSTYKSLHNNTDTDTVRRAVRAIEIADYYKHHEDERTDYPNLSPLIVGVKIDRDLRRKKISERLQKRLNEGMIDEIKRLMNSGVKPDDLIYYGLEYKYVTQYVIGELSYDEMYRLLEIAIHQFAKRQMTWFRGMERRGFEIKWLDATMPMDKKVQQIISWTNH